mmetsp:Transcript_150649/g.288672  ORF Transcript_150649/g.288672 Transcript_150649/m.288672 type:complete len:244 (+) Transcript_150649:330-1061(+)
MRFTRKLRCSNGLRNSNNCCACSGLSLRSAMRASSKRRLFVLWLLFASALMNASLSSTIEWRVVGTRSLRSLSSTACTDHASLHGSSAILAMRSGEGPTVDTMMWRLDMAKASGCTSMLTAVRTFSKLLRGSPMPMKTMLTSFGKPCSRTMRRAVHTCTRISSAFRFRTKPMVPVLQKAQAREQPTCEDTHREVCAPPYMGMITLSTESPSASVSSSFCVPSSDLSTEESDALPATGAQPACN